MPKKEKIPPPGNKKDEFTNFLSKAKWKQALAKAVLECNGRNMRGPGAKIVGNALAKNKWVTHIDFSHNHFGDAGAIELAQILKVNETIQNVNLSCNEITDVGGIAVASSFIPNANPSGQAGQWNRSVYYLNLSGNLLGADSLFALACAAACHRDLVKVELQFNKITALGCKGLLRALQRNPVCQFVLSNNEIGDEGAEYLSAAWKRYGVKGAQSSLNLTCNDICSKGATAIGELLGNNDFVEDVSLGWNSIGARGMQLIVPRCIAPYKTALRALNVSNNLIADEGAVQVGILIAANVPSLTRINVASNEITEKGGLAMARALIKNEFLVQLIMTDNKYVRDSANEMTSLPATRKIDTDETGTMVAAFCEAIGNAKALKVLDFRECRLTDSHKNDLGKAAGAHPSGQFRCDVGFRDDVVFRTEYLDKLTEWSAQQKPEDETKAKGKKKKK